jgi:hypothetical protein
MKKLYEPSIPKAWKALNDEEYSVGDRMERIGFFYFNGRAKEITRLPEGDILVNILTLEEEEFGGLGFQLMRISERSATSDKWESVAKDNPEYKELLEYSQRMVD